MYYEKLKALIKRRSFWWKEKLFCKDKSFWSSLCFKDEVSDEKVLVFFKDMKAYVKKLLDICFYEMLSFVTMEGIIFYKKFLIYVKVTNYLI